MIEYVPSGNEVKLYVPLVRVVVFAVTGVPFTSVPVKSNVTFSIP